jgi:hypothetical protein
MEINAGFKLPPDAEGVNKNPRSPCLKIFIPAMI